MKLTREQLYDAIWKTPALRLAKSYGISNVALAKICRKFAIPKPGIGHWRRVELGRTPPKPPLPNAPSGRSAIIKIKQPEAVSQILSSAIQSEITSIQAPENKIQMAEDFRKAHPLVRQARAILQKGHLDQEGRIRPNWNERCLAVRVTKISQNRALLIIDALFKAVEKLGHEVEVADDRGHETRFKIGQETVKIILTEKIDRTERELTAEEKGKPFVLNRWVYRPTGKFVFRIDEYHPQGGRKSWSDGKKHVLEDQLNEIVETVILTAEALRLKRLEREEQSRKWEEERRRRAQLEKERQAELARRNSLIQQADLWAKSNQLHEFIEAVAERLQKSGALEAGSPAANWLDWAKNVAEELDPLTKSLFEKPIAS